MATWSIAAAPCLREKDSLALHENMTNENASPEEQLTSAANNYATSSNRSDTRKVEHAVPRSGLGGDIPRIVILDENAVYDHYMRRLNRVWMRRVKVGRCSTYSGSVDVRYT